MKGGQMRTILIGLSLLLISCTNCPKFVNYDSTSVNVKGIQSKIPTGTPTPVTFDVGEVSIDPKNNREASETIQRMDLTQNSICRQIDGMSEGPDKEALRKKYVETLINMLQTTQSAANDK